ncbi:MAG: peptidoglycan DD-metalloendopeptidase family protein [Anaerolineae bacterium]|nr:peptidoglycan DD-metalloendopeptidase family protein [Anaerolineae bacterium]
MHLRHANDYDTLYGHLSVLRVQTDDKGICEANEFGCVLGISGSTGHSSGPHLHFELEPPGSDWSVNPYGWIGGTGNDPWEKWTRKDPDKYGFPHVSYDLWQHYPSITNGDVYPSGASLTAPPMAENEPGYVTVDDGDADYSETPGCWTEDNTAGWAGDHRHRDVPGSDCTATWNFPASQPAGYYNVFVYVVPNDHAATDAAQYTLRHTESPSQPGNKQSALARVNQLVYPDATHHPSSWVYIGTYYFNNQYGADYVRLEAQPLDPVGTTSIAADAVRFAPVVYRVYLPLTLKRWPPLPDIPVLNAIANPESDGDYPVSWQRADLADTYLLQEAPNAAFGGAVPRYSGAGTLWTATGKAVDTYYYRVKARNSWGDSGWSNVRQTTVRPPAGWQTIAGQDFEGAFPGEWITFDNNGATGGEYYWDDRTCRAYTGSYSGWGVGGGAQGAGLACGSNYPDDAYSWLYYGPFDLEDAIAGELAFKLWLYSDLDYDQVSYVASVDGTHFQGYSISGNTHGWGALGLDLADVPNLGNLLGEAQVWVALIFSSNDSVNYAEGGYVDDVVVRKCFRGPCPSGSQGLLAPGAEPVRVIPATLIRRR